MCIYIYIHVYVVIYIFEGRDRIRRRRAADPISLRPSPLSPPRVMFDVRDSRTAETPRPFC